GRPNAAVVAICGRLEAELSEMEEKEAAELLASYGLKEPGLNRLIRATYDLMGLIQFFTAGEPEVRAWTIRKGATGGKAAGETQRTQRFRSEEETRNKFVIADYTKVGLRVCTG